MYSGKTAGSRTIRGSYLLISPILWKWVLAKSKFRFCHVTPLCLTMSNYFVAEFESMSIGAKKDALISQSFGRRDVD